MAKKTHVAVVNHVVVSGQCPNTCLPCDRVHLSVVSQWFIYSPVNCPSWEFSWRHHWNGLFWFMCIRLLSHGTFILAFFHFQNSELSAVLCWLRLCQGCGLSLILERECWPSCMVLLSCWDNCGHTGIVVPHWAECIGKCWNLFIFWCGSSFVIPCWGHR